MSGKKDETSDTYVPFLFYSELPWSTKQSLITIYYLEPHEPRHWLLEITQAVTTANMTIQSSNPVSSTRSNNVFPREMFNDYPQCLRALAHAHPTPAAALGDNRLSSIFHLPLCSYQRRREKKNPLQIEVFEE